MISLQAIHRRLLRLERQRAQAWSEERFEQLFVGAVHNGVPLDPDDLSAEAILVRDFLATSAAIEVVQEGITDEEWADGASPEVPA